MSSLDNINSYLANDPALEMRVKKTLQKCFNELTYTVSLPIALVDGGTAADLSATGGPGEVLVQAGPGDPITVRALALSDLSDYANEPVLSSPNVSGGSIVVDPGVQLVNAAGTTDLLTIDFNDGTVAGQTAFVSFFRAATNASYTGNVTASGGLALSASISAGACLGFVWSQSGGTWRRFQ